MSLQYIVDAYNLINHPKFKAVKHSENIQQCLVDFVKINKLTGSSNNRVILVFDGYPPQQDLPQDFCLTCMFSRDIEADEVIKKIVEESAVPRNIIVISDDKQVQLMSRLLHAQVRGVEEFICGKRNKRAAVLGKTDFDDLKVTYSQMQKIDAEFKKRWLG
ncbi:MAG: NYN domain-containing protein [Candidatus Omnitrophota bacterium]